MQTEGGGFRMTRDRQTEDGPAWREPAAPPESAPVEAEAAPEAEKALETAPETPVQADAGSEAGSEGGHSRASLPDRRRRSRR